MNVKVYDLMTRTAVTTQPHRSASHVRKMMQRNKIGSVPVVDTDGKAIGIVSTTDLIAELKHDSPISKVMTEKVVTVAAYDDVSTAARVMRSRGIHRVVVTHEQKVVGMLSSFDLLQLVEKRRFVAKNPPTPSRRTAKRE